MFHQVHLEDSLFVFCNELVSLFIGGSWRHNTDIVVIFDRDVIIQILFGSSTVTP